MITVIDYGAGNIRSVSKALETAGGDVIVTGNHRDIEKSDKIVLPGVGAFGKAIEALSAARLIEPLLDAVAKKKPFLGICLGLQLLFNASDENPGVTGLSLIPGTVKRFPKKHKVPHLGWNQIFLEGDSPLWKEIPDGSFFYFAHSYYVKPESDQVTRGTTEYGDRFVSAVAREQLFGLQFHPEKSQKWGLKILKNFVKL
jgi:glutamine amidotransferase